MILGDPQITRLTLPFSGVWGVIQGVGTGTHVGYLWSDRVNRFLDEVLVTRGLAPGAGASEIV